MKARFVRVAESIPGRGESLYCQTHERMEPIAPGPAIKNPSPHAVSCWANHPGLFADLEGEPFKAYTCDPEAEVRRG